MKKLYPIILLLILSGCLNIVPLKGEYPGKPIYGFSERPIDEVWNRLIDVVTDEGLDIRFVDRSSGLVMSDELSLLHNRVSDAKLLTFEDRKGNLIDPGAYAVSERTDTDPKYFRPYYAAAKWSVVLRETEDGRTAIKISLSGLKVHDELAKSNTKGWYYKAYSLGNFENWLFNEIK